MAGLALEDAPRDGRMVWLLVDYSTDDAHHPLADSSRAWTIGFNNLSNDGVDEWRFAGWCWSHDHFTQGQGTVLAWLPIALNLDADADEASAPCGNALLDVARERHRQVEQEGWTPAHDDMHATGALAAAASCYAIAASRSENDHRFGPGYPPPYWPGWAAKWWKPKDRRHNLVRAGALIVAEIERLDRAGGQ